MTLTMDKLKLDDDIENTPITVIDDWEKDISPPSGVLNKTEDGVLIGGGSFGQVYRIDAKHCRKRGTWSNDLIVPSCDVIKHLSYRITNIFPLHFPEILTCNSTKGKRNRFEMSMQCINDAIPLRLYMTEHDEDYHTTLAIYAQLYYITRVLNDNSIFHNDFDVRNIMVWETR